MERDKIFFPENGKIYKYRGVKRLEDIKDIIENNRFWAASPLSFNDPFDCIPYIKREISEEDVERNVNLLARSSKIRGNDEQRKDIEKTIRDIPKKGNDFFNKAWKDIIDCYGVVSFSEKFQNLLMWSHYADNHQGVCIEVSLNADLLKSVIGNNNISVGKVSYVQQRPVFSPYSDDLLDRGYSEEQKKDFAKRIFFQKYDGWKYEDEWRFVKKVDDGRDGRDGRYVNLPEGAISRIIMGMKSSDSFKKDIKSIVSNSGKSIPIVETVIDSRDYAIRLK